MPERATEPGGEGTSAKTISTPGAPLPVESDICRVVHEVTVAGGRFAPGHLGELTRIVHFGMVDAVLASTGRVQRRVRDLPSRVVVYLLLAAALFEECGYRQGGGRVGGAPGPGGRGPPPWPGRRGPPRGLRPGRPPAGGWGPRRWPRCSTCCAVRLPGRPRPARGGTVGCWWRWTGPRCAARTPRPTWPSTARAAAITAAPAIRWCGWSRWSPAAPGQCWPRRSGRPAAVGKANA